MKIGKGRYGERRGGEEGGWAGRLAGMCDLYCCVVPGAVTEGRGQGVAHLYLHACHHATPPYAMPAPVTVLLLML